MKTALVVVTLLATLSLASCGEKAPIRVGFIGGITGRMADLGAAARNGAQLAIDERNAAGGIGGRKIELVEEDDKQESSAAVAGFRALQKKGVAAIVGPVTSNMATAVAPLANEANIVLVSPTATTQLLSAKDDHFFRVVSTVTDFAARTALILKQQHNVTRATVIVDKANADYTLSWADAFKGPFTTNGGTVLRRLEFDSRGERSYAALADQALKGSPQAVILVTSATDGAFLAQKLRDRNRQVVIVGTGWTGTQRLLELGGKAVEGMLSEQYFNLASKAPAYLEFRRHFLERFGDEPGFAGTLGYDATTVVLEALADQASGESLKQTLLRRAVFKGLQDDISFDRYGDCRRVHHHTVIYDGSFVPLP